MKSYAMLGALALVGCALEKPAEKPQMTEQRQQITNITYFDLVSCDTPSLEVTSPLTKEALVGMLVAARPQVLECMVDPKNRGKAKNVKFAVDASATDSGWEFQITGDELPPEGQQCVKETLDHLLWFWTGYPKRGAESPAKRVELPKEGFVSAHVQFEHVGGVTPTVNLGVNEASDLVGRIRLAERGWCDCFQPWNRKPPYQLVAKITLIQGKPDAEIKFEPSTGPGVEAVQACLSGKIAGLKLSTLSAQLSIPYPFILVNSGVEQDLPDATKDLRVTQMEGVRSLASANTAIMVGARSIAFNAYDGAVKKYKAKPHYSMVKPLKEKCAALVKADDAWVKALERQLEVEEKTLTLTTALKAQDPQWAEADQATQNAAATAKSDVEAAKKAKLADAGSCPKERF